MNIIGLDTTTHSFCIGLIQGEKIHSRIIVDNKGFHSEEFLHYLEKILKEHNLTEMEIDGYAISIGPGSLTGIRVGLAFLKGIGFVTGKPVVPVETLFAVAYEFRDSKEYICPVLTTKKKKVFCALYRFSSVTAG
ncbi:tRNA (adenosine(37)-N6)-threonylcarbamoyltransferase complex dimerization subunit type 1 TsaB, partial [candidate division WOR-3 bacterium]|nr:tRNA (adenosine(37)-N6)-threonylcarbamoyltransferase complex dimerization subunit type 1 TsaB [candidate division WOR-3 bacterium]